MSPHLTSLIGTAILAGACLASSPAHAETTTICTLISSLPATLTAQGKYCLDRNLSTSVASGSAITVATNNITIDCNDHLVAGTAPLATTRAKGIYARDRINITIRNCTVRGFETAIELSGVGASGHRVERTLLAGSSRVGLMVEGEGSQVLDNRVVDTGGTDQDLDVYGMIVRGDAGVVQDNFVADVVPSYTNRSAYGIQLSGQRQSAAKNSVFDIAPNGTGQAIGTSVGPSSYIALRDNTVVVRGYGSKINGRGLQLDASNGAYNTLCLENFSLGFSSTATENCGTASNTNR